MKFERSLGPDLSQAGLLPPRLSQAGLFPPGRFPPGLPKLGFPSNGLPDAGLSEPDLSEPGLSESGPALSGRPPKNLAFGLASGIDPCPAPDPAPGLAAKGRFDDGLLPKLRVGGALRSNGADLAGSSCLSVKGFAPNCLPANGLPVPVRPA